MQKNLSSLLKYNGPFQSFKICLSPIDGFYWLLNCEMFGQKMPLKKEKA